MVAPLNHLTNKGIPFVQDIICQVAFEVLKKSPTQSPVLACPNLSLLPANVTGAAKQGISAHKFCMIFQTSFYCYFTHTYAIHMKLLGLIQKSIRKFITLTEITYHL